MKTIKFALGSDHAGFSYKEKTKALLLSLGHQVEDFGAFGEDSVDYPDFVHPVAYGVESGVFEMGIVICGSGNGVAITANKHRGIRAALCWEESLAKLARQHNNANIMALPARFVAWEEVEKMILAFINTPFEGGRHEQRVQKIPC
jgi:ribose 5-phosphate isomerase B